MNIELENFKQGIERDLNQSNLVHANNIIKKIDKGDKLDDISIIVVEYEKYRSINQSLRGYSDNIIKKRVEALNNYFNAFNPYKKSFSAQSKWRSTILEEFMFYLFRDLIVDYNSKHDPEGKGILKAGTSIKAYANAFIQAKNLNEFIRSPQFSINEKDQDFSIYRSLKIKIEDIKVVETNIPVISIENKTFVDKTMLEGSIATAEKIKSGNPYSLFLVVTETWDVALKVDPAYSRIDQTYVLRKTKRNKGKGMENNAIYSDVVLDLFRTVKDHLDIDWSNPSSFTDSGKVILLR